MGKHRCMGRVFSHSCLADVPNPGSVSCKSDRPMLRRACLLRCLHCPLLQPFSLGAGGSWGSDHSCCAPSTLGAWELHCGPHVQAPVEEAAVTAMMCCLCPRWVWPQLSLQNHSDPLWVQPCSRTLVFLKPSYPLWLQHAEISST